MCQYFYVYTSTLAKSSSFMNFYSFCNCSDLFFLRYLVWDRRANEMSNANIGWDIKRHFVAFIDIMSFVLRS